MKSKASTHTVTYDKSIDPRSRLANFGEHELMGNTTRHWRQEQVK